MLLPAVLIELVILYLVANRITNALYHLFLIIFRSKYVAGSLLTFLYLPGTVIHEFAHLLSAEILRVPTGEISFTPKIEKKERDFEEIKMGSVEIVQTDPFRKLLIAVAPVLFGLFFLFLIISLFQYFYPQMVGNWQKLGLLALAGYFLFAVSNNMFSSSTDLKDTWFLPIILCLILVILYFMGIKISLSGKILYWSTNILSGLAFYLGIVLGINVLVLLINLFILKKVFSRKL